ncbi:MAG: hypothetical protein VX589_09295 [Myxococcota bacterium]|nr:hypothetical protein [Myxococcota bacterium]
MTQRTLLWVVLSVSVATVTWFFFEMFGIGLMKRDAVPLALVCATFTFGLQWIKIPPRRLQGRSTAPQLTRSTKRGLTLLFTCLTMGALGTSIYQGLRGYPPLTPDAVLRASEPVSPNFYTVTGKPMIDAMYTMSGSDGAYVLVPLKAYEGRVLVMLPSRPKPDRIIKVTGEIRAKIRTVQRSRDGQVEGPFLRLYREHLNLPPETTVYFLDTGHRAGLNVMSVSLTLLPLYFLLLVLSVPIRRKRPPSRPKIEIITRQ